MIAPARDVAQWLFRIAALLSFAYAVLHSYGALLAVPHFSNAAAGVRSAMSHTSFPCSGATCTWWGFYLGFGWIVAFFFALGGVIAWFAGSVDSALRTRLRPMTAALGVSFAATAVITRLYFFPAALAFAVAIAACLFAALWLDVQRLRRFP